MISKVRFWRGGLSIAVGWALCCAAGAEENSLKAPPQPSPEEHAPSSFETQDRSKILQLQHRIEELEEHVRALSAKMEELRQTKTGQRTASPPAPYLEERDTFQTSTVKELPPPSFGEERETAIARTGLPEDRPREPSAPASSVAPSSALPLASPSLSKTSPPLSETSPPLSETSMRAPDAPAAGPQQEFDNANAALGQKNYTAAQAGFRQFIKSYPTHSLVPNAVFGLGESHYGLGNYADAAEAFDLVLQGYGNSPKAPESLIKKGMALAALGKKADACAALGKLPSQYPTSTMNIKAQALDERARIGCP